jgi:DNA processing protein
LGFSAQDALIAATLCPGLPATSWTPALVAATRREAVQPGLFEAEAPDWASIAPAGARAAAVAAWQAFLAGPAAERVASERARAASVGGRVITPVDADWPEALPRAGVLWAQGDLGDGRCVALVGSRKADRYGRDLTARAARAAAEAGVTVVSGGALGTDAVAHTACLDAGGRTIVVLGSGLHHPAPATHVPLFERARANGAVVSPFPCDVPPGRHTFPRRNAWIAGLSAVTVVLQAGATSGALHTARAALALGRPLYALPGPVDSPLHQGSHGLLDAGAKVLRRPDAFLTESTLLTVGVDKNASARTIAARVSASTTVSPPFGLSLWQVAGAEPVPLASLAEEAGIPAAEAAALALQLELAGWLRAAPGGRFARATP